MFFKKKELPAEIYKGDPLWTVVLSQLKTQALCLSPYFRNVGRSENIESDALLGYQRFETFLSQIEDSNDLTNLLFLKKSSRRSTSLAQIAADVGENYARRFGSISASKMLLLVDDGLPSVKSYPPVLMRIADCLVRAGQRLGGENGAEVRIHESKSLRATTQINIVIECVDFEFGADAKRLSQSITKFRLGKYAQCINDLGLDLCAGLHLASQLGAAPELKTSKSGKLSLEIRLVFERSNDAAPEPLAVGNFYMSCGSERMAQRLQSLAKFHLIESMPVTNLRDLPAGAHLVFDATKPSSWDLLKSEQEFLPKATVFLVTPHGADAVRGIVGRKFKHFHSMPLVSSKLIRALFEPVPQVSAPVQAGRTDRPLRVMVVDDTETARIVICDHLESKGHTVVEADDGSECVELIRRGEHFDLVICDLNMCHIDGLTMVKMLREFEQGTGKRLPVVLMTAFQIADGDDELESAGVNSVLIKPVKPDDIDRILTELFEPKV